jgi:hypothetical protein
MSGKSQYDPSRDTVGKIYRDAQMKNKHEDTIEIGDMGRELTTSLIEDINDAIENWDKGIGISPDLIGKPYYLMIHEKKDLQMQSAIARRMMYFGYRPWPEDDTVVFWKDPKVQELRFCWALPHWSEMDLILMNEDQFDKAFISQIKSWRDIDLKPFGFRFHSELRWIPDPNWVDEPIKKYGR